MDELQQKKSEIPHIKVEVLETEDNLLFKKEELSEFSINEHVKFGEHAIESTITKYDCDVRDQIFNLKDYNKEYGQAICKEEAPQSISTSEQQEDGPYYKCEHPNCGKSFKSTSYLNSHMRVHNKTGTEENFKCEYPSCGKSFLNIHKLNHHVAVHSDARPFKCKQAGCPKAFKREIDLNEHMIVHSDEKPFKCTETGCKMTFKRKKELHYHLRSHSDERAFICNYKNCVKSFKYSSSLRLHIAGKHRVNVKEESLSTVGLEDDSKLHKCGHPGCGKIFGNTYRLNSHVVSHSDKKPFKCTSYGCSKSFKRRDALDLHMRSHEELFRCTYESCDGVFKLEKDLIEHMRNHSDNKPLEYSSKPPEEKMDVTPDSPNVFVRSQPDSSSAFRTKRSNNSNIESSNVDRQYRCSVGHCNAAFYRKSHLTRHITTVHIEPLYFRKNGNCNHMESQQKEEVSNFNGKISCKKDMDEEYEFENIYKCSVCEETFSEEIKFQEHVNSCGKYMFEFVGVNQIEPHD